MQEKLEKKIYTFISRNRYLGKLSKCRLESSNWHDLSCKPEHDSKFSLDHCTLALRFFGIIQKNNSCTCV